MNWLLGAAALIVLGPPVLRAVAGNPDALKKSADLIETGRNKAIELGKRGASAAYDAARAEYEKRRASQLKGTFGGLLR
jgi:hypothetical protein